MKRVCVLFLLSLSPYFLSAQVKEQTGWLVLGNSTKFNQHWGMNLDIQFRSADNLEYVRNFIFRPAISYYLSKKNTITAGYMLNDTYTRLIGAADNTLTEHRIWQQFLHTSNISKRLTLSQRFRLEQRFIERASDHIFAQRFRFTLRGVMPLIRQDSSFRKGAFVALQDEVFFNVQNKEKLNGSLFDQNRVYAGLGYRFSPKLDMELGYLNQWLNGRTINTSNNVVQLGISTRF